MSLMGIDRRQVLIGSGVSLAAAMWPVRRSQALVAQQKNLVIAACRRQDGGFSLLVLSPDGQVVRAIPLSGRGHDVAFHRASGRVAAFARRPGRFALSFSLKNSDHPVVFLPPRNRHFYGHGTFSRDGRLLFATENDFANARGVVGIYDATAKFVRVGEYDSYGVGPHDMLLLGDGKTLVVANGGIETHPESGRIKLNLATMEPSLCFIDLTDGSLITRHTLSEHHRKLSIRHLTADQNGTVWFGGQWQGDDTKSPGLVGSAGRNKPLRLFDGAEEVSSGLRGYIGSVALSRDGRWLAASAPRAGKVVYFDIEQPGVWRHTNIKDASGIAPINAGGFLISSGSGALCKTVLRPASETTISVGGIAFDNHVRVCPVSG